MGISTRYFLSAFAALLLFFSSCTKQDAVVESKITLENSPALKSTSVFAQGADVSWLGQFESWGVKYQNASGVVTDCFQLLKNKGVNSIRFRVLVNPPSTGKDASGYNMGFCDPTSVVNMAVRAKNMGFRIMIDFHYSDYWTDPAHQSVPAAWSTHTLAQLSTDIYNHTYNVLTSLKNAGVTPEWVQVGNEINPGICLPKGASSTMANTSQLLLSGYNAVKAVNSSILVVLHLANAHDNATFRWFFDAYKANGGKWDVIGMSAYPAYGTTIALLQTNLNDMASRYGKYVMVCETGYSESDQSAAATSLWNTLSAVKAVPSSKGIGCFYWEPESHSSLTGYTLGAAWKVSTNLYGLTTALNAFGGQ